MTCLLVNLAANEIWLEKISEAHSSCLLGCCYMNFGNIGLLVEDGADVFTADAKESSYA